jgi:hypothetical protein
LPNNHACQVQFRPTSHHHHDRATRLETLRSTGLRFDPQFRFHGYDSDFWLNTYDLNIASSAFVPVTIQFERAGTTSFSVLSVSAVGSYEGIAPNPASAPQ